MRAVSLILTLAVGIVVAGQDYWGVGDIFALGSAREVALGGFLSAASFLPEALHANPAALGFAGAIALSSFYSRLYGALDFYSLEAAGSFWGIGIYSLAAGLVAEDHAYTAYGVILATGFPLGDHLGVGAMGKGFFQAEPGDGFGWALDPALMIRANGITTGVVFENAVSFPVEYGDHREPWPWGVRGGIAVDAELEGIPFLAMVNVHYSSTSGLDYALGLEARIAPWSVRLGYGSLGVSLGASLVLGDYGTHWGIRIRPHLPLVICGGISWELGG